LSRPIGEISAIASATADNLLNDLIRIISPFVFG